MSGYFVDCIKGLGLLCLYGWGEVELVGVEVVVEGVCECIMKVLCIVFLFFIVLEFFVLVSVVMVVLYFGLSYLGLMLLYV